MIDLIKDLEAIGLNPVVLETAADVAALPQALPPVAPDVHPLDLDDIRKRVMADQPITIEEEKLLLGSIRRGYSMQVAAAAAKPTRSAPAATSRGVAKSATGGGKVSTSEQFAALGGLDVL